MIKNSHQTPENLRTKAARGVKWTAVSTLFSTALQIIRIVVLGRLLAPSDFGLMAMMLVVTGFAGIFGEMGLGSAIIQRPKPTRNELSSLYWINVLFGAAVYLVLLAITPFVANFYSTPALSSMLPVASLVFLFIPWGSQFRAILQKELDFKKLSLIEVSSAAIGTTLAVALAWRGWGVWALVYAQLAESAFRTLWLCVIGWRRPTRPFLHFSKMDLKGYLWFGLNQVGAMSINYFNSRADQLVIGVVLGPEALGFYSMAFNLVMMPIQKINPILTRVAFPVFAQVQHDRERLKRGYLKMLTILATVNAPVLLGFSAVAPLAIPLILGEKWTPIIPLAQILCVYALMRSMGNPGGSLVMSIGRADIEFYWNLGLLFLVPTIVFLAGTFGKSIELVAWTLVGLQLFLWWAWYLFVIKKILGSILKDYAITMLKPFTLATIMALITYFFVILFPSSYLFLFTTVGIGVLVYLLLNYIFNRQNLIYLTKFIK